MSSSTSRPLQQRIAFVDLPRPREAELRSALEVLGCELVDDRPDVVLAPLAPGLRARRFDAAVVVLVEGAVDDVLGEVIAAEAHGILGYDTLDRLASELQLALYRFARQRDLSEALERRAVVERAKGILMERYSIDEREAFERLRTQARRARRKLVDTALSLLEAHALLPRYP